MFISNEFKEAVKAVRLGIKLQSESDTKTMSIKKLQLISLANGFFTLTFSFGDSKLITVEMLLLTAIFWSLALWLHLATPKGSTENWPPQFQTFKAIRSGFFKLESYPRLKKLALTQKRM